MACCGSGSGKKSSGGKPKGNTSGSRPLSYTKKLNIPFGQPKIKSSGLKFGRS